MPFFKSTFMTILSFSLIATASAEEMPSLRMGRSIGLADRGASDVDSVQWLGFAVSPRGRVFRDEGGNEPRARQNAKNECELRVGSTCQSIAVPSSWDVSAVLCEGGAFVAGSDNGVARTNARKKAASTGLSEDSCEEVYKY